MVLEGGEGLPQDEEQTAAEAGRVTEKQILANQNLEGQVARKVMKRLDETLVPVRQRELSEALEERRRIASAAKEKDNPSEKQDIPVVKKEPWWKFW